MAEVTLTAVRKVYPGGHEAVRDLSLAIADGELLVLVGPSGCGKTTTLRMVAGLEEATAGTIGIGGRVVNGVAPKDRDVAMVFQNYALYPHMTVRRNMAFALTLRRLPRAEIDRRVREAARILGIEELLDRRPRQLSGGQRQRVAVGRAIVREPKAFLFDEPLSNLDARMRITTRAELKALHHRLRTTTIYVTHDQEEAMTLGDRVAVMSRGLLQQVGPPLEVYARPANRFVAGFIGTPPMNLIEGRIEGADGALVFVARASAELRLPVAPAHRARLGPHAGREVVLGLRPQSLRETAEARPEWPVLQLRVGVVEPLGDTMDVSASAPGDVRVVARVPARTGLSPGAMAPFAVDTAQAHYFEPGEFGRALLH